MTLCGVHDKLHVHNYGGPHVWLPPIPPPPHICIHEHSQSFFVWHKTVDPPSPVSCHTSVAIIPYCINEIRRKQDAVVYKMSHTLKLWELLSLIMFRWRRMYPWNLYAYLYFPVCTYICSSDAYAAYIGLHVFTSAICTYGAHLNLQNLPCLPGFTYTHMHLYWPSRKSTTDHINISKQHNKP